MRLLATRGVVALSLAGLVIGTMGDTARADEFLDEVPFPREFALGVEAHGGLATPMGFAGLAVDAQFTALSLSLGVGRGIKPIGVLALSATTATAMSRIGR